MKKKALMFEGSLPKKFIKNKNIKKIFFATVTNQLQSLNVHLIDRHPKSCKPGTKKTYYANVTNLNENAYISTNKFGIL